MRNFIITLLMGLTTIMTLHAQDTLTVQTLTYDSIKARRGVWQFPEGGEYRKVLMYYTLKCDQATTHDNYACGEWDYLTYTTVYEHTGMYDSTLYHHPKYQYINGDAPDEFNLTNDAPYTVQGTTHYQTVYEDTISVDQYPIVFDDATSADILATDDPDGRARFMITAGQLADAGMTAGPITGMNLHLESPGADLKTLMVRLSHQSGDNVGEVPMMYDADTVYFAPAQVPDAEWMNVDFLKNFQWDGASNIMVDLSYSNSGAGEPTVLRGAATDDTTLYSQYNHDENYAIALDGEMDFLEMKSGSYFDGDFTYQVWLKKRANNTWSRVFDFGNGPGQDNVIIALSNSNTGKMSFHIRQGSEDRSFMMDEALPLHEWVHITLRLANNVQGVLYVNGEQKKVGRLWEPEEVMRSNCFIGKSNWEHDPYADVVFDEMRLYNYGRSDEAIFHDAYHSVENPQEEEGLVYWLDFNEPGTETVEDLSGNGNYADGFGMPSWQARKGHDKARDFVRDSFRPDVVFENVQAGNVVQEPVVVQDTIHESQKQYVVFGAEEPTLPLDTLTDYIGGYRHVYLDGQVVDSNFFDVTETLQNDQLPYYGEPFEIIHPTEIGRFITPYGIGLTLGPEGFTWVYDVTDYAHLLRGDVDLKAGNQQELIDLKFKLIEGTPPRDVVQVQKPWGSRQWVSYNALSSDSRLNDTTLILHENTQSVKMNTRLTGHGHHSNDGSYPHCCEWKDNTHYLLSNNDTVKDWHIFKYVDCAANPIFPQGGTWLGAREGWCPGDKVDNFDFELTEFIADGKLNVDYAITPVPEDNQGMGSGNYIVSMHMMEYGEQNFERDAELYDILVPAMDDDYRRRNPACTDPLVVIRNNGADSLQSLSITYGVEGGKEKTYHWQGALGPHRKTEVVLPVDKAKFWVGDGSNRFYAKISQPNGMEDQYAANDIFHQDYHVPDLINQPFVLRLEMNKRPDDFDLTVTNLADSVVFERHEFDAETEYYDTLDLEQGCYTLRLTDQGNTGLSYWAWPGQGSGHFMMYDLEGDLMKRFESEFGNQIRYAFSIGSALHIEDPHLEGRMWVAPNPSSGRFNLRVEGVKGDVAIQLCNIRGEQVWERNVHAKNNSLYETIQLNDPSPGIYFLRLRNEHLNVSRKIIIR